MKREILKTDNYLLIVDESEIKVNDWYYLPRTNSIYRCQYDPTELEMEKRFGVTKVIAHLTLNNTPILEGVPLLPPLEIVYSGEKELREYISEKHNQERCVGFIDGYNKAKETYKFTEKQIDVAIDWAIKKGREGDVTITDIDNLIQSLSQPKMPTHFEFEMNTTRIPHDDDGWKTIETTIKTTNSQGQEIVCGKYVY